MMVQLSLLYDFKLLLKWVKDDSENSKPFHSSIAYITPGKSSRLWLLADAAMGTDSGFYTDSAVTREKVLVTVMRA